MGSSALVRALALVASLVRRKEMKMTCPSDWSTFGSLLLGLAALLVALPLGFILWFVLCRTVSLNPQETKNDIEF
jgi:hypothetical protein